MNRTRKIDCDKYIKIYVDAINNELRQKKLDSIEVMSCSAMSLDDIFTILFNLDVTLQIKKKYGNETLINIYNYVYKLKEHADKLLRKGKNSFDSDVEKSKDLTRTRNVNIINIRNDVLRISNRADRNGDFAVIYKKSHTDMTLDEIEATLEQFKRAVGIFFETYQGRQIVGKFTGYRDLEDREIKMELKTSELLHILGITREQVLDNNEFVSTLKLSGNESSFDILMAIYNDIVGDKKLISAHEKSRIQSELLPYNKVRAKTLSFMKSGSFSQPKLICELAYGKKLGDSPRSRINSNVATIARHNLSNNYVWAYLGGVYLPQLNKQYTETLINDSAQGKIDKFSNQEPKMLVETQINSGWSGTVSLTTYSEDEKMDLFYQAYNDFGGDGGMNFEYLEKALMKSKRFKK